MITADAPDVYGYTIFCDDLRVEVGGKLTYVGVYPQGRMNVQGKFPLLLPKFAMHFFYFQRRPNIIPPTKIIVVAPGSTEDNPAVNLEIDSDEMQKGISSVPPEGEVPYLLLSAPIMLSNFVVPEAGDISVRAVRGDQLIRLGRLIVIQDPKFVDPPSPPT